MIDKYTNSDKEIKEKIIKIFKKRFRGSEDIGVYFSLDKAVDEILELVEEEKQKWVEEIKKKINDNCSPRYKAYWRKEQRDL